VSTATVQQIGQDLRAWLAAVQRGETVAIVDDGREVARLAPPRKAVAGSVATQASMDEAAWARQRLMDLEATFPQPVQGASAVLEEFRADRV
jgi:antitoxin (DNA-binding transcriptional repressor) of toxin-antitoxin stability system